jgi:hypothetical protein
MKKILFFILLSISSFVHAQWTLIEKTDSDALFIDYSTIKQVGKYKRVWQKTEYFKNSEMIKHNVRSTRTYVEHDCSENKIRNLSFSAFKQSNLIEFIMDDQKTGEWKFIAPDTYAKSVLEIVCKK